MSLKINKKRSNIDNDIEDDIFGNWKVQPDEELTKFMGQQIQESINIEIMKRYLDSVPIKDSKSMNDIIDPYYRPVVTVKFNEDNQIVLEYENKL